MKPPDGAAAEPESTANPLDEPIEIKLPPDADPTPQGGGVGPVLATLTLGTLGAIILLGFIPTCAMGASRSARLKWAERNAEIEQAIRASATNLPAPDGAPSETD